MSEGSSCLLRYWSKEHVAYEMERPENEAAPGAQHEEKFVCDRCFDDYAIKDFIKAHATARQCSFCGRRNLRKDIAALGRDVLAFIRSGLRSEYDYVDNHALPYDDEEGRYTVPVYDMWDLIHDQLPEISSNEAVLDWIVESLGDGRQWCDRTPLSLSPEEGLISGWEDFCEEVKHKTRYLFFEPVPARDPDEFPPPGEEPYYIRPAELLEEITDVVRGVGLIRELPAGTRIFRVRPHDLGAQFSTPCHLGPALARFSQGWEDECSGESSSSTVLWMKPLP